MGKSKDPVQDNSVDSVQEDQVVGLEGAAAANHNGQWNRRTDSSGSVDAAGHSLTAQELQIDLDDKLLKLHQEFIASFEGVYLVRGRDGALHRKDGHASNPALAIPAGNERNAG